MNNPLPTAQWTTLTDLLWPQAVLRGTVLSMGHKEGSVCRLCALFASFALARCAWPCFPSAAIFTSQGVYTQVHTSSQRGRAWAQRKYMKIKNFDVHTCSQIHAHTFNYKSTILRSWEANSHQSRSISLLLLVCLILTNLTLCQQLQSLRKRTGTHCPFFYFKVVAYMFMDINVCYLSTAALNRMCSVH